MPRKGAGTLAQQRSAFEQRYLRGRRGKQEITSPALMTEFDRLLKQERLCFLKASDFSHTYCADALGVSRSTITEWLADEQLKLGERIAEISASMTQSAVAYIESCLVEIADALMEIFRTTTDEKLAKEIGFEMMDRMGLSKVNKSESIVSGTVKQKKQVELTDSTGVVELARGAPPEVLQQMAQHMESLVALAQEHGEQSDSDGNDA
jgi:hypothetical protein